MGYVYRTVYGPGDNERYQVGYYDENGVFEIECVTPGKKYAARRTAWLNGSSLRTPDLVAHADPLTKAEEPREALPEEIIRANIYRAAPELHMALKELLTDCSVGAWTQAEALLGRIRGEA